MRSTFDVAYPVMRRHKLTGIVALITGTVGGTYRPRKLPPRPCMTIEQLRTLIMGGWEVASHSVTHPFRFDKLDEAETLYELKESKKWIEENLGVTPTKFVVPRHLIRPDQMMMTRAYYRYVRPLGNPVKGHVIFHHLSGKNAFESDLRKRGVRWGL